MKLASLRHRVHTVLHNPTGKNQMSRAINWAIAFLILTNALAVAMETVKEIHRGNERAFFVFEAISTVVFLAEYLCRLWASVEQPDFRRPVIGRIKWALRPMALLDLIVVATFFAPVDLRFLRLARILRLLRVLHMPRLASTYEHLRASIAARKELLLLSAVLMIFALFGSASLLYIFEHAAQPAVFSSIPATMWWSVVTLTTIGYGDIFPITTGGKICAGLTAVFGIGVFALPTAIVTSAIIDADGQSKQCPHCGKSTHS
jgi:voltage-gated potassium channel